MLLNYRFLSEKSLLSLVHALCQLSDEAMQVGTGKVWIINNSFHIILIIS